MPILTRGKSELKTRERTAFRRHLALLALWAASLQFPAEADDWPEWRGPRRDGISSESGIIAEWPAGQQPRVAWRAQVGRGHSSISVSNGRAYTMGWDGQQDTVYCLDAASGRVLWKQSYPCAGIKQWPGPRSTPAVAAGRVFTLSQHGLLHAFEAATGKILWKRQLRPEYNPDVDYGFAWSPLVVGDLVIVGAGSRGMALRVEDGQIVWGDDGKPGTCASPIRVEIGGRQAVALIANNAGESVQGVVVDPTSRAVLYRTPMVPEKWGAACIDPIVRDGSFFITTAEQNTAAYRFALDGAGSRELWSSRRFACYTGSSVLLGNALYGVTKAGILKCLDWQSGEERWAQRGFDGHGALVAVGGLLLVQASQSGDLVIVAADPSSYRELRRARVFTGDRETFTAPVAANGRIYCRSYAGEVVCLATGSP